MPRSDQIRSELKNLGWIAIARSRVEPVQEITSRLEEALDHIDADRLIAAPDCSLGLLNGNKSITQMANLAAAAHANPRYPKKS